MDDHQLPRRRRCRDPSVWLSLALLLGINDPNWAAAEHPADQIANYLATYGEVPAAADSQVSRAHEVFARVRAAADKNSKRLPKLVVIDSPSDLWAAALPDGHIVLSRQAVAIVHGQAPVEEIEARLAFVLGHELAHLANEDFSHREIFAFQTERAGAEDLAGLFQKDEQAKARELEADDRGFIYAALAGYRVETLLGRRPADADFFTYWMRQTQTRADAAHPQPGQRAEVLRKRLLSIRDELAFFEFGVRLAHFDYCDDAMYFLRRFQRAFPGREVFNNLGYCSLQLARQAMGPERAYFYWLPSSLDGETRAGALTRRGGAALKSLRQAATGEAGGYLQDAEEFLRQAVQADPRYLPARLNLAAVSLYQGNPHDARATLDGARALAPDDPRVPGLDALALYEQSDAGLDLWPTAIAALEKLAEPSDAPPEIVFNAARLLEIRPRVDRARGYWNRLAARAPTLPEPVAALVCQQQNAGPPGACLQPTKQAATDPPWRWPVAVARLQRQSPQSLRGLLKDWRVLRVNGSSDKLDGHIYYHPEGTAAVLELDQFVQVQVLRDGALGTVQAARGYCPRPLRPRELAGGTVWSCADWAVLARGDEVREVWWVAR
ncbi:MAG TPA: hypothetical protein DIC59_05745 [Candidatus Competibacteraceae bacterium]|nr:hypothetical protein [Candidatus Competibacteraceae bacterium]